jgi:glycosyltransferase involved in cell wall biosynthesis
MISFIVIGRNEGWKLTRCFESIAKTINYNALTDYEIIYIDSASTDDSLERAKAFKISKIYIITGKSSAGIARNIGAREANGDVLFFIDGDIEISPEFLKNAFTHEGNLKHDYITGHLIDKFYDTNNDFIAEEPRTYNSQIPNNEIEVSLGGGIFMINKRVWEEIGGIREKYRVNEDQDLTLRLKNHDYKSYQLPHLIGVHNTIDYRHNERMWKIMFSGNLLYPAVLLRDHLFDRSLLRATIRNNYTFFLMTLCLLSWLISNTLAVLMLAAWLLVLFARAYKNMKKSAISKQKSSTSYFLERILHLLLRDIMFGFSFLFFYPTANKSCYSYKFQDG